MEMHHAHILYGDSLAESPLPVQYKTQSADVLHVITNRFSIDDARELTRLSEQKPFESDTRVFVIDTKDIAIEAQNALLKLLEEPPLHARFYIVTKRTAFLLPTLRSRLYEEVQIIGKTVGSSAFDSFISLPLGERLALIAQKTKEKDLAWQEDIVRGCEVYTTASPKNKNALLGTVVFVRSYIGIRGASSKMLLEELALSVPVV